MKPSVSVMIPTYHRAAFLREAIASVQKQTYAPLEILVMDDGSTDNTGEIAKRQNDVLYFALEHHGLPATRQRGIEAVRGELVAFLDGDDLWSENKLSLQTTLLRENPGSMLVNGHTQLMRLAETNEQGMRFENWGAPRLAYSFGSALFRRAVFALVGGFDDAQSITNDLDWFLRAREKNVPMVMHQEVTQFYRRHMHNMTNHTDLVKQQLLQMLQKSLTRRDTQTERANISLPALEIHAE